MGKTSRKKYTPEFMAQVAIEALGQGESLVKTSENLQNSLEKL